MRLQSQDLIGHGVFIAKVRKETMMYVSHNGKPLRYPKYPGLRSQRDGGAKKYAISLSIMSLMDFLEQVENDWKSG